MAAKLSFTPDPEGIALQQWMGHRSTSLSHLLKRVRGAANGARGYAQSLV